MDRIRSTDFPENFLYEYTKRTPRMIQCPDRKDLRDGIEHAISTLPETEQRVVNMRYKDRKIYKSIARELNVSDGYPYQILQSALEKLREEPRKKYIIYGFEGAKDQEQNV